MTGRLILAALACVVCTPQVSTAAAPNDVQIVQGKCGPTSHIAEGAIGDDLTKRQSRFFCDSAVLSFYGQGNKRILVQFAEKRSHVANSLGFAGEIEADGIMMDVDHIYLQPSSASPVEDANCKFFFKHRHMTGIFCGAKVDEDERRTVAIVVFDVNPGQ